MVRYFNIEIEPIIKEAVANGQYQIKIQINHAIWNWTGEEEYTGFYHTKFDSHPGCYPKRDALIDYLIDNGFRVCSLKRHSWTTKDKRMPLICWEASCNHDNFYIKHPGMENLSIQYIKYI